MKNNKKVSKNIHSELLLSLKDIEKFKSENIETRQSAKVYEVEKSLEKYNKNITKALEAPIPNITLHYSEVLVRAVPAQIKSKGGLIISASMNDIQTAKRLESMSHAVDFYQEILMVGKQVSEKEQEDGIRPGRIARCKWDRYKTLDDDHTPGVINTSIKVPFERIGEYNYIIIDKRDILYTKDKS